MPSKTVRLTDLRTATEASIKAALGRSVVPRPGVLVGLWLDQRAIKAGKVSATTLARRIASDVSRKAGIRVTPVTRPVGRGVLFGYIQPRIRR